MDFWIRKAFWTLPRRLRHAGPDPETQRDLLSRRRRPQCDRGVKGEGGSHDWDRFAQPILRFTSSPFHFALVFFTQTGSPFGIGVQSQSGPNPVWRCEKFGNPAARTTKPPRIASTN